MVGEESSPQSFQVRVGTRCQDDGRNARSMRALSRLDSFNLTNREPTGTTRPLRVRHGLPLGLRTCQFTRQLPYLSPTTSLHAAPSEADPRNPNPQFSGVTLTTTTLYLSLLAHQRHRHQQKQRLGQQVAVLNALVDGRDPAHDGAAADADADADAPRFQLRRVGWSEAWKDRWNAEVEQTVRWAQDIRWDDLRAGIEGRVAAWREQS